MNRLWEVGLKNMLYRATERPVKNQVPINRHLDFLFLLSLLPLKQKKPPKKAKYHGKKGNFSLNTFFCLEINEKGFRWCPGGVSPLPSTHTLNIISKSQSGQMFWSEIPTRRPQECDGGGHWSCWQVAAPDLAAHCANWININL